MTLLQKAYPTKAKVKPALIAFFDTKPYDEVAFSKHLPKNFQLHFLESRLGPKTAKLADGHSIVCAFVNDDLSAPVLKQLKERGVELIALRCAGYNNIDIKTAAKLGISVVRVPAYSPHAVAEHAVALILTLNRKTHRAFNRVREGNFSLSGLVGFDLHGRTIGIVGLGKIGHSLAKIMHGFGMQILAYDTFHDEGFANQYNLKYVELDELLRKSDIISLHTPLLPETYHMINNERISIMKRGIIIINTSRGGLVDTRALIKGLKSGQIGAAGLDVYEEESAYFFEDRSAELITDDTLARLMTFHNVLITSHQAFLTVEALDNIAQTTLANIDEYYRGLRGKQLTNAVSN
ncbi:MAG: 2-hydroxyacid dehydrogenase [Deltaproteobacteria bacterium]|nr:2-hydroxyacid dehydrogenase [Deltaproteobacteria bacterium]